jgi:hypothetical protein
MSDSKTTGGFRPEKWLRPPDREQQLESVLRRLLAVIDQTAWRDASGLRFGDGVPALDDARGLLNG